MTDFPDRNFEAWRDVFILAEPDGEISAIARKVLEDYYNSAGELRDIHTEKPTNLQLEDSRVQGYIKGEMRGRYMAAKTIYRTLHSDAFTKKEKIRRLMNYCSGAIKAYEDG
jgi:hypothetical protein